MAKMKEYTVGQYAKLRGVSRTAVHLWILKNKDGTGKKIRFKRIGTGSNFVYIILSDEERQLTS